MATSGLDRRASKLEDSLEYLRNKREAEEHQSWREANSEKLRWEMFIRNHGPDSIPWTEKDFEKYPDEKYDIEAGLACQEMLQKVLAKYKDDEADHKTMDRIEMAFAYLLNEFSWSVDPYSLFDNDIDYWLDKLNLDEIRPPHLWN